MTTEDKKDLLELITQLRNTHSIDYRNEILDTMEEIIKDKPVVVLPFNYGQNKI